MFAAYSRFICCNTLSCVISDRKGCSILRMLPPIFAKKNDFSQIPRSKESKPFNPIKLLGGKGKYLLLQSALGVFALGFIDAGYSGDWSRIGVISRGTEDLLKAGAFAVVPLCIFLIFFLSRRGSEESTLE